jgi:hypothetical protein
MGLEIAVRKVRRMLSSGMLCRLALARRNVSEEHTASIIRVTRIIELRTLFLRSVLRFIVTANGILSSPILVTLMMEEIRSSETPVLTRATRYNMPEDGILHSHRRGKPQILHSINRLISVAET